MRVTSNTTSTSLLQHVNELALRQSRLQTQIASGQKIQNAADDPVSMRRLLRMDVEAATAAQYQKNIGREQDRATAVHSALKSLKQISDRAGEIATLADDLKSPEELALYTKEVTQLIKSAVQIANTRYQGASLFAGTKSDQQPFALALGSNGLVTGASYQGNDSLALTEIGPGTSVSSQIVGANLSGSGPRGLFADSASGADFLNHLISLQNHLASGDVAAVAATDRAALARDEDNLLFHLGQNGITQSQLETSSALMKDQGSALETQVSKEADADLTQVIVKLNATQTAYQAALQSGAQLMGISLMNFLR